VVHIILAIQLVQFTGPDNQPISVNPMEVVSVRPVRKTDHMKGNCIIHTSDGKFVLVSETCDVVKKMLLEEEAPPG